MDERKLPVFAQFQYFCDPLLDVFILLSDNDSFLVEVKDFKILKISLWLCFDKEFVASFLRRHFCQVLGLFIGQGFVLLNFTQNRERYGFGQIVFAFFFGDFGEGNFGELFGFILFQGAILDSEELEFIFLLLAF